MTTSSSSPALGFIGAGNYASRMLIPAFKAAGGQMHTIATQGGHGSVVSGTKSGFGRASSDLNTIFDNEEIGAVVIVTRHDSHADLVAKALKAGKHVFVEKPLAIDFEGLEDVEKVYRELTNSYPMTGTLPLLMVGYNRRFSPHILKMKSLLETVQEPKSFIFTMNAGHIPDDHWTQNANVGGGRILGEACHYIDLMRFLASSPIVSVQARRMGDSPSVALVDDKATITLGFEDGSFGTILYLSNGSAEFPKERVEVFAAGRTLQLQNFRSLRAYGWDGIRKMKLWKQDKGQNACAQAFLQSISRGQPAIPIDEIFEVARVTLQVATMLRNQE